MLKLGYNSVAGMEYKNMLVGENVFLKNFNCKTSVKRGERRKRGRRRKRRGEGRMGEETGKGRGGL